MLIERADATIRSVEPSDEFHVRRAARVDQRPLEPADDFKYDPRTQGNRRAHQKNANRQQEDREQQ